MNTPNPSVLLPGSPRRRGLQFLGDPRRVLDVFAVEVHDVETAVRSGRREHAVEPGIGRGKEIFSHFSAFGDKGSAVRDESAALNEVVHRFADKKITVVVWTERVAAIDGRAARGREVIRRLRDQQRRWGEVINPSFVIRRRDRANGLDAGEQRLAVEIALLDHDVANRDVVEHRKTIAPIIVCAAELGVAGDGFKLTGGLPCRRP